MSAAVTLEIYQLLNSTTAGTAVFNVSVGPSDSGFVAVDVQVDTSVESQLILNSTIFVDIGTGTFVATTSDPPSDPAAGPGSDTERSSNLGTILGAVLGAALVALLISVVVHKRQHQNSAHDMQHKKAIRLDPIDLVRVCCVHIFLRMEGVCVCVCVCV
jgi:hypothetical protein